MCVCVCVCVCMYVVTQMSLYRFYLSKLINQGNLTLIKLSVAFLEHLQNFFLGFFKSLTYEVLLKPINKKKTNKQIKKR